MQSYNKEYLRFGRLVKYLSESGKFSDVRVGQFTIPGVSLLHLTEKNIIRITKSGDYRAYIYPEDGNGGPYNGTMDLVIRDGDGYVTYKKYLYLYSLRDDLDDWYFRYIMSDINNINKSIDMIKRSISSNSIQTKRLFINWADLLFRKLDYIDTICDIGDWENFSNTNKSVYRTYPETKKLDWGSNICISTGRYIDISLKLMSSDDKNFILDLQTKIYDEDCDSIDFIVSRYLTTSDLGTLTKFKECLYEMLDYVQDEESEVISEIISNL